MRSAWFQVIASIWAWRRSLRRRSACWSASASRGWKLRTAKNTMTDRDDHEHQDQLDQRYQPRRKRGEKKRGAARGARPAFHFTERDQADEYIPAPTPAATDVHVVRLHGRRRRVDQR